MLIDTSVLIALFRDRSGVAAHALRDILDGRDYCLTRFTQMELLQGARDEKEWLKLSDYLADQDYLEVSEETWAAAARLYFDLRRKGLTVRSVNRLLHCGDRHGAWCDASPQRPRFPTIAKLRSLKHVQFDAMAAPAFHEPEQALLR